MCLISSKLRLLEIITAALCPLKYLSPQNCRSGPMLVTAVRAEQRTVDIEVYRDKYGSVRTVPVCVCSTLLLLLVLLSAFCSHPELLVRICSRTSTLV